MFDELFPDARAASLSQAVQRPVQMPEPGVWQGFGSAVADALPYAGQTTASAWTAMFDAYGHAAAFRDAPTMSLMHGEPVADPAEIQRDTLDRMGNSELAREFRERAKTYAPDPAAVGVAGRVAHGLLSGATKMTSYAGAGPAGPVLFGMDSGINRSQELTDQGVDQGTAALAGVVTGTASATMMRLPPALGATRAQSAAIGAVAAPTLSVAEVGGIRLLLEHADYDKIAAQYQPFDPLNLSIAALTGGAFGAAFHLGKPAATAHLTPQQDYRRFLSEFGLTEDVVRMVSDNPVDQIPMPPGTAKIERRQSSIDGEGMFATESASPGELLAPARIGGMRTPAGRFTNHSNRPNAEFRPRPNGDLDMVAIEPIEAGTEVVIDYRQAAEVNGWGAAKLTPDEHAALLTMNEVQARDGATLTRPGDVAAAARAADAQALARQQMDAREMVSVAHLVEPDPPTLEAARAMAFERMTAELRAELIPEAGNRAEPGAVAQMTQERANIEQRLEALRSDAGFREEAKLQQEQGLSRKQAESAARKVLPERIAALEEQAARLDRLLEANRRASSAEQDLALLDRGEIPERYLPSLETRAADIVRGFEPRPIAQGIRNAFEGRPAPTETAATHMAPTAEGEAPAGIVEKVRDMLAQVFSREEAAPRTEATPRTPEQARALEIASQNPDALVRLEDGSEARMADLISHADAVEAQAKTEVAAFEAAVTCALRFPQ